MYSVSIFRWFYGVSPLLLKIQGCGFCDTVLLFRKTIDAVNRTFLSLMVFRTQGVFENFAFWGTVCNSVKLYLIKKVKNKPNVLFNVEISDVIIFFLGVAVFEKLSKLVFFKWDTLYIFISSFLSCFVLSKTIQHIYNIWPF